MDVKGAELSAPVQFYATVRETHKPRVAAAQGCKDKGGKSRSLRMHVPRDLTSELQTPPGTQPNSCHLFACRNKHVVSVKAESGSAKKR